MVGLGIITRCIIWRGWWCLYLPASHLILSQLNRYFGTDVVIVLIMQLKRRTVETKPTWCHNTFVIRFIKIELQKGCLQTMNWLSSVVWW